MFPPGGEIEGGPLARCLPVGAPRPNRAAGVQKFKVQVDGLGRQREEADGSGQGLPDTEKGAAEATPFSCLFGQCG